MVLIHFAHPSYDSHISWLPQLFTSLTHSQVPFKFSFQSVTFPSPQLTARMLPARLHETRQTTSGNLPCVVGVFWDAVGDGSRVVLIQGAVGVSFVQTITDLSYIKMQTGVTPNSLGHSSYHVPAMR